MSAAPASLRVKVARKAVEAEGICSFELVSADGAALPTFSAGSHIDVHLPNGLVRPYSLCNDPAQTHRYLIAVLLEPASRGGSQAMHAQVHEGDELIISPPRNHFALAHEAKRHLLLAGGIGITPLLCMAEHLAATGGVFHMHYCTRSRARTAFASRLEASSFAAQVQFHHDDGPPEQQFQLDAVLAGADAQTHLYVCGPQGFMDAVLGAARARGWPESRLHYECFSAEPVSTEGDRAFEVVLASSGRVVPVPAGQTVVQALASCGIDVMVSCEQGVCGTCLTRVLDGQIDHRDAYLTPEERAAGDQFTPCVSRAKSARLVLDL
jgi:vanillate O-demethylase ferredoxin subunit